MYRGDELASSNSKTSAVCELVAVTFKGTEPPPPLATLTELNVPAPYEPDPIVAVVEIKFPVFAVPETVRAVVEAYGKVEAIEVEVAVK